MKEYPSIRYRLKNGQIEKRKFESQPPFGWSDSPADLVSETIDAEFVVEAVEPPRRRGRPPGSRNKR